MNQQIIGQITIMKTNLNQIQVLKIVMMILKKQILIHHINVYLQDATGYLHLIMDLLDIHHHIIQKNVNTKKVQQTQIRKSLFIFL